MNCIPSWCLACVGKETNGLGTSSKSQKNHEEVWNGKIKVLVNKDGEEHRRYSYGSATGQIRESGNKKISL